MLRTLLFRQSIYTRSGVWEQKRFRSSPNYFNVKKNKR